MVSTIASGSSPHGGQIVDVGENSGDARAIRVSRDERRQQRLSAGDHLICCAATPALASRGHHGTVVARTVHPASAAEHLTDQLDLALRPQRRMRSKVGRQLVELDAVGSTH